LILSNVILLGGWVGGVQLTKQQKCTWGVYCNCLFCQYSDSNNTGGQWSRCQWWSCAVHFLSCS